MASIIRLVFRPSRSSYLGRRNLRSFGPLRQRTLGMTTGGQWRLASLLKSFVRDRKSAQGSAYVCWWRKSATRPPLDQPCDPWNCRRKVVSGASWCRYGIDGQNHADQSHNSQKEGRLNLGSRQGSETPRW
jgi:hypothetical protein